MGLSIGHDSAQRPSICCVQFVARCLCGTECLLRDGEPPLIERILCPTGSLDVTDNIVCFAGHLAGRVGALLELIYVVDPTQRDVHHKDHQQRCKAWCTKLRDRGVTVNWNVLYGRADKMIAEHAAESKASLILFGLHRSGNQMIDCPDGVVSATIRQAPCPVMTVPSVLVDMR